MKKSIKKFLVITQALGWSTLVASACTEEQVKTAVQNTINSNKSNDGDAKKTDQDATNHKNKANSEVSDDSMDKGGSPNASKDVQEDEGKTVAKPDAKDKTKDTHEMESLKKEPHKDGNTGPKANEKGEGDHHPEVAGSEESEQGPGKGKMGETTSSKDVNSMEHGKSNPETASNLKKNEGSSSGSSKTTPEKVTGQDGEQTGQPSGGGAHPGAPRTLGMPTNDGHGGEQSPKEVKKGS